jgi:hypothetical protein
MTWLQRTPVSASGPPLLLQSTPVQRMLAQGVMAVTGQLVRGMAGQTSPVALRWLVEERHRLLRELGNSVTDDAAIGCLAAMTAAVIESDLALEVMLGAQ